MRRTNLGSNLILGFFLFCAVIVIIQLYGLPYFPKNANPPNVPIVDNEAQKLAVQVQEGLKQLQDRIDELQRTQSAVRGDQNKINEQMKDLVKAAQQQSKQLDQLLELQKQMQKQQEKWQDHQHSAPTPAPSPSPSPSPSNANTPADKFALGDSSEVEDEALLSKLKRAPAAKHDLIKRLHKLLNPPRECNKGGWQQRYTQLHNDIVSGTSKRRFVTYRCNGGICGGFGDRMVGVTDAMMVALMDDRAFLMDWTSPFDITKYLASDLDWKFEAKKTGDLQPQNMWLIDQPPRQHTEWARSDMSKYLNSDNVIIQANQHFFHCFLFNDHYKQKLDDMGLNQKTAQGCLLNYLYHPNPAFAKIITDFKEKHFSPVLTIGMQIRTGGDGRLGTDPVRIPYDQTWFWWECAKNITRHLGVEEDDVKWFVSTDSERVRDYATKTFGNKVITTNGTITHIELSPSNLVNQGSNDQKILLDHRLLIESDFLIASPSNFGRTASTISGKYTYMYWPDFLINTCDLSLIEGKEIDWNMKTEHCPPN